MSKGAPVPLVVARRIATGICDWLYDDCDLLEIAGSIRRKKPMVNDIELVAISKQDFNFFGEPVGRLHVDDALAAKGIVLTLDGPRYKQFVIDGLQVDLFLATKDNFGWILLLRTGSSDFGHKMVTRRIFGGYRPENIITTAGYIYRDEQLISLPTEASVFALWEMDYIEPEDRL